MAFELDKNSTVDTIEVVPEHLRPLYVEQDGKFSHNTDMKGVIDAIVGLSKSNAEATKIKGNANKEAAAARQQLKAFADVLTELDLPADDLDAFKTRFAEIKEAIAKGDAGKVNWDKVKQDMEKAHNRALGEKDTIIQSKDKAICRYLVNSAATAAIAAEKGVPELLLPHIQSQVKVVQEGEDYVVRVVDNAGDPRGDGKGGFMTIADLVKEMKSSTVFGRAFEAGDNGGSGAPPNGSRPKTPNGGGSTEGLSAIEKIRRGLQKGQAGRGR